ncbi:MAG: hypothetical protein NT133_03980 [Alphaproteobacteria bacterium]|nr:hypothetical protein [Alphaproteobacteria bacterium]
MSSAASIDRMDGTGRHPWLAALVASPAEEVRALIELYAEVHPYGRAEPGDAAHALLFGLAGDDPARAALDAGCGAVLLALRAEMDRGDAAEYPRAAMLALRLLTVIRRLRPAQTVRDLHRRYMFWFAVFETAALDDGLDVRREFLRVLALTQDMAETTAPRRLMALWLDVCAEAGPNGQYDPSYLDVGLSGLRDLPLAAEHDANEEAMCHGIARWAVR